MYYINTLKAIDCLEFIYPGNFCHYSGSFFQRDCFYGAFDIRPEKYLARESEVEMQ